MAGCSVGLWLRLRLAPRLERSILVAVGDYPNIQLNLNVRGMKNSATVAINERSNALRREGREIFKLGLGQSPFPVPECVVQQLREHAHEKDYLPVRGLPELRDAVAQYHRDVNRVECEGSDVLIGPGSKELMFLLQLVYYGDLVIPTPAWVSYAPQARIIGRQVRMMPTKVEDDWRLRPDGLERLCSEDRGRPRIVIINYPSNPSGGSYDGGELGELAAVARQHEVVLLSDEIYGELHHRGRHESIARYYPEGTIISSGLSKWCGAGGWRLGTFLFPPSLAWLLDAMAAVASETFTSTAAPIQYAAVRAFQRGPEIERHLVHSRAILSALGRWIAKRLRSVGIRCADPIGAFYLMPDFTPLASGLARDEITSSAELCERLLSDTGVAMLPGSEFGRPAQELSCRLAYVDFDGAAALNAAVACGVDAIDDQFVHEYCGPTVEAIERTVRWAHERRRCAGAPANDASANPDITPRPPPQDFEHELAPQVSQRAVAGRR